MLQAQDADKISPQECRAQIERLLASPFLQESDGYCRLIQFLGDHALNNPAEHLKEYQIATEILGRPADFDPQLDSSVRVKIGRLRNRLAKYYRTVGKQDPVIVEIPRGKYTLSFRNRNVPVKPLTVPIPAPPVVPPWYRRRGFVSAAIIVALLLIGVAVIPITRAIRAASQGRYGYMAPHSSGALEMFWSPFLDEGEEPFVVFKNSEFVGSSTTGLRRIDPSHDRPDQLTQRYTGIGEVMAVHKLTRLFDRLGWSFHLKRSGLFTVDDARDNDLIFIGSPSRNLSEIPSTHEFVLKEVAKTPNGMKIAVIDSHPKSGSSGEYFPNHEGQTDGVEFAIVALEKGLDRLHWTLYLEGTSTVATEAAVDFVCSENSISDLLQKLHETKQSAPTPFEGLLRVKVANDIPVDIELLDLRRLEH